MSKSLKMKLKMHDENVYGVTPDENTRRRVSERINNKKKNTSEQ
jgi:hypothetical protein